MKKNEISDLLKQNYTQIIASVEGISDDLFFTQYNNKWSIAENLVHLAKSAKGFNSALAMPRQMLANLGSPEVPPRSYDEIVALYHTFLNNGGVSTRGFVPLLDENQRDKNDTMQRFIKQHEDLNNHLNDFTEEELDTYVVPHPLMGKLSLREMYGFMAFHVAHHQKAINKILNLIEV